MSEWNHPMCNQCWEEKNPDREPVRIKAVEVEHCCWCGGITRSGIYVREDPVLPPEHQNHAGD